MTGSDCATPADVNNSLAAWLSESDGTHLDSAPLRLDAKFTQDGVTIDAKLGTIAGALGINSEGVSGELAILKANTSPPPGEAPVSNNALSDQGAAEHDGLRVVITQGTASIQVNQWEAVEYIVRQLSGHHDYESESGDLFPWSVTDDVNAHTDEGIVLLQGDMNDHEANTIAGVNAHTTDEVARALADGQATRDHVDSGLGATTEAINGRTEELVGGAIDTINTHTDEAIAGLDLTAEVDPGPINLHTTDEANRVVSALDATGAQLVAEINDTEGAVVARVNALQEHVDDRFDALGSPDLQPINDHTTAEANRVISAVNTETNRVGASIIASNDTQTVILVAVQSAVTALGVVVGNILDRVTAIALAVAEALGLLNNIWTWAQAQPTTPKTLQQVAETAWSGTFHWNQVADVYAVDVTTWPTNAHEIDFGTVRVLKHAAWCAIRSAQGYVRGPRIEFTHQAIPAGGILATGLLLHGNEGTSGVVRAYRWL